MSPLRYEASALAVVVLSHGPRATLCDAVRSVLRQDVEAEIVVVHSGAGDVRRQLRSAGLDVRVVQSDERLLPGAARNLGIAETRAPFIAFLADDCIAEHGWVRSRLQAHRAGASAVASALVCHQPTNPIALAAHLSLYFRRMPRAAPSLALKYGVSYARTVFERHGGFRADLESGEDTEFNQRLVGAEAPIWTPEVLTVHRGADTTLRERARLRSPFWPRVRLAFWLVQPHAKGHLATLQHKSTAMRRSYLLLHPGS